jgi:hypothetical protein
VGGFGPNVDKRDGGVVELYVFTAATDDPPDGRAASRLGRRALGAYPRLRVLAGVGPDS